MSKMTVMAFQLEGDEAAISSGCEMIVRAIRQITGVASPELVGQASGLANNARASALAPPSTSAGLKSQVAPALAGGLPGTEHRLKPVPLNQHPHPSLSRKGAGEGQRKADGSVGTIAARILRYLAESHENGDPDCTVDEVHRISGAGTKGSAGACLVQLKVKGLAQIGSGRGKWQISEQGLALVKREKQNPHPSLSRNEAGEGQRAGAVVNA